MWDKTILKNAVPPLVVRVPRLLTCVLLRQQQRGAAAVMPLAMQDAQVTKAPADVLDQPLHPRIFRGELVRKAIRRRRTPHVGIIIIFEYATPEEPLELSFTIPSVKHAALWDVTFFQEIVVDDALDDDRFGVMDTRRGRHDEASRARVRGETQHVGGGAPGLLCRSAEALPFSICGASLVNLALARSRRRSRERRQRAAAREVPFLLRPSRIMLVRGVRMSALSSHGFAAARVVKDKTRRRQPTAVCDKNQRIWYTLVHDNI